MYRSILVAAGLFSQGSTTRALVQSAARLAAPDGRITIVHAMEDLPPFVSVAVTSGQVEATRASVRRQLDALATAAGRVPVGIDLRTGKPAREILESAEDNAADLIMLASHKPGLRDYFIGSTAARVVRHARCSVLVSRRFA